MGFSAGPIAERISSGSSWTVTPPVSFVASSSAGISAQPVRDRLGEHHRHLLRADPPGQQPLAGLAILERLASSSWTSSTSTSRSRMRSTNASNSCRARRTQITSSKSSSVCSRPGRCTRTFRSLPTSGARQTTWRSPHNLVAHSSRHTVGHERHRESPGHGVVSPHLLSDEMNWPLNGNLVCNRGRGRCRSVVQDPPLDHVPDQEVGIVNRVQGSAVRSSSHWAETRCCVVPDP